MRSMGRCMEMGCARAMLVKAPRELMLVHMRAMCRASGAQARCSCWRERARVSE